MTVVERTWLAAVASEYERVALGKINVRSVEGLGIRASQIFAETMASFADAFDVANRTLTIVDRSGVSYDHQWSLTRVFMAELDGSELGELVGQFSDEDFLAFTFKSSRHTGPEGPVAAIDRRLRWVAIAPPDTIAPAEATSELQALLRAFRAQRFQSPEDVSFDVDSVCSSSRIQDWLFAHEDSLVEIILWLRHTNPGKDLSELRKLMKSFNAQLLEQRYTPPEAQSLAVSTEAATELGHDAENGNLQAAFKSSDGDGFDTVESQDQEGIVGVTTIADVFVRVIVYLFRRRRPA